MFDPTSFVGFHTWLSIIAIVAGAMVIGDLLAGRTRGGLIALYLATAVATSVTGFGFPFTRFLPSHAVGAISLVALADVLLARYVFKLEGVWRCVARRLILRSRDG